MEEFAIPLSSPFTWKPSKICKLWSDFHNLIKHQFENGERVTDPEILAFRERLRTAAIENQVLGPTDNWRDVLGDNHFKLVTRNEFNVQTWWESSVVCLLRVIRNKHEHVDGISDAERDDLGWFVRRKRKYKLEDKRFASYWISKFPNLVQFLWSQYGRFRASWSEYYPGALEYDMDRWNFGLLDFVKQLEKACFHQLENGYLEERFQCATPTCSIELRTLTEDLLGRVLDGGSILELIVTPQLMKIVWDGKSKTAMEYRLETTPNQSIRGNNEAGGTKYFFASGSGKVDENTIFNQYSRDTLSNSKIVIFTTKDAVEGIVTKLANNKARFERSPINWLDVSECKRKEIECSEDFVVSIQSSDITGKDLLPGDKMGGREGVLTKLDGRLLNQFLRSNKLSALKTYSIPEVDKLYQERGLYNLEKLHHTVFEEPNEKDVFLVLKNVSEKSPPLPLDMTITQLDTIFPKFTLTSQLNIVTVADSETKYLQESLKTFQQWKDDNITKNIHFFRYLGDDNFKWVATYGSLSSVQSQFVKAAKKAGVMTESKLLTSLKSRKSSKRLIFIADQPGMGKSQVLINLAGKMLRNGKEKNIIMLFSMPQFVDIFQQNCDGNEDSSKVLKAVIKTITDLTCSETFEEALVTSLLGESENSSKIRFEIMLDGLDEVASELRNEVAKILQAFHSNATLPVRVWVTLRDYMLDFIKKKFNTLGFKLDPLNENEQIGLLTDLWNTKRKANRKHSKSFESLRQFARKCIKKCLSNGSAEVAGIPLQCRMIAEIFEVQVREPDFSAKEIVNFDLIDLYEKLVERKLEVYIREKKMLPASVTSNDSWVRIICHSLNQYLEFLSIQLIFSEEVANVLRSTLSIPTGPNMKVALTDMVLEHGIVQNLSPLKFIHRTFAEYLVARFVTNFLRDFLRDNDNLDDLPPHLQDFLWNNVLAVKCVKNNWKFTHPTLCHFLDNALKPIVTERTPALPTEKSSNFLESDAFKDLLLYMKVCNFSGRVNVQCAPIFFASVGNSGGIAPLKNIFCITVQSPTRLNGLFILTLFLKDMKATKIIIEDMNFGPEHWHLVQAYNESKLGIIHRFFRFDDSFDKVVTLDEVKSFISYLFEKDPNLLKVRDAAGRTPLLCLVNLVLPFSKIGWKKGIEEVLEVLEFLHSLGADIHDVDESGNTVLHLGKPFVEDSSEYNLIYCVANAITYCFCTGDYLKVLKFFFKNGCNRKEVNCFNSEEKTPLLSCLEFLKYIEDEMGAYSYLDITHEHVLQSMNNLLRIFLDNGMDLNVCGLDGKSVLCHGIDIDFSFLTEVFQVVVDMGRIRLVKYLISEYPSCLYIKDKKGKSVVNSQSSRIVRKYFQYKITGEMGDYISCAYSCM